MVFLEIEDDFGSYKDLQNKLVITAQHEKNGQYIQMILFAKEKPIGQKNALEKGGLLEQTLFQA